MMFKFLSGKSDAQSVASGTHYEATISGSVFYRGSSKYVLKAYYSFPRKYRNPKIGVTNRVEGGDTKITTYGSKKQFLTLYRLLCNRFFGGQSFLDPFFKYDNLKNTINYQIYLKPVEATLKQRVEEARERAKVQKEDYRTVFWRELKRYFQDDSMGLHKDLDAAAKSLKTLIIRQLATGKIPISHRLSTQTLKRRRKLGIESQHPFYATGQLINSIIIELRLEEE